MVSLMAVAGRRHARGVAAWSCVALIFTFGVGAISPAFPELSAQGPGRGGGGQPGGAGAVPGRGRAQGPARDAASQTVVGTGAIAGVVVAEGTGLPVRRASVTLSGAELRGGRSSLTDDQGRFTFQALPAGRFMLMASKAGYVNNAFGAKRAGRPGTPIQLAEGQKLERLSVSLPRGGVITGVVVDENGEPSPNTTVRVLRYVLRTGERTLQQVGQDQTDDRGIYRVFQLQPGEYVVSAVPRNLSIGGLRETMAAEIEALARQVQSARGGAGLGGMGAGPGAAMLTDRLAALQQQMTGMEQQQSVAYAPVYYPGTPSISAASSVMLGIGEERTGVDFQLQLVSTARVSGVIQSAAGALPQGTQIALVSADRGSTFAVPGVGNSMTRVGGDGRFTFSNVTPGQYVLQARSTAREGAAATGPGGGGRGAAGGGRGGAQGQILQVLWASADVAVSGQDIDGIVLNMQPGMPVSGRVEFKRSTNPPPDDLTRVRVTLSPRGQQAFEMAAAPPTQADATGRFRINGVSPGRYSLSAGIAMSGNGGIGGGARGGNTVAQTSAGGWSLESAMANGRDVLDFPIDIGPNEELSNVVLTFTDRTQEISGTIQDVQGRPTADFTIIVFPTDSRYWLPQARRIVSARPATDGRFAFRNLPTGEYRLTAVTDVEPGEWYDPAFLAQLVPVSIPLSLAEGEKKVQDIKLAGGN